MKDVAWVIYLALSSLLTITLNELGIHANKGIFWLILGCFMGAFLCGMAYGGY